MTDARQPKLDEATRTALLGQFAVGQLLLGLALVEGFMLDVVIVPTARVAALVLRLLKEDLPERRGEVLEVRVLAPDPGQASIFAPVEADELLERVLVPLMTPIAPKPGVLALTWVDASTAGPDDEPAWTTLFHRLNQRRNAITENLPGPLLVVLPPRMEERFAHEAPDAWSVRSGVHRVKLADVEAHALDVYPERRPSLIGREERGGPRYLNVALAMESERSVHIDDATRSWAFAETVDQLLASGDLDGAEAASRAALTRAESAMEQTPTSSETARSLSRALATAAQLADGMGDVAETIKLCARRIALSRHMLAEQGLSTYWRLALADALSMSAVSLEGDASLDFAREAVATTREVLAASPEDETARDQLVKSLTSLAQIALAKGLSDETEAAINEAISRIGDVEVWMRSGRREYPVALVTAYAIRADARARGSRFADALADARKSLEVAEAIRSRATNHILALRMKAVAANLLARIYAAVGDLGRAASTHEVGRAVTKDLVKRWPQSAATIEARITALRGSVEVALEADDRRRIASWLTELQELSASLPVRDPHGRRDTVDAIAALRQRWEQLQAMDGAQPALVKTDTSR